MIQNFDSRLFVHLKNLETEQIRSFHVMGWHDVVNVYPTGGGSTERYLEPCIMHPDRLPRVVPISELVTAWSFDCFAWEGAKTDPVKSIVTLEPQTMAAIRETAFDLFAPRRHWTKNLRGVFRWLLFGKERG